MSSIFPTEIRRLTQNAVGSGLYIKWADGNETNINSKTLRLNCPCATCLQKRGDISHEKPLTGGRALLTVVKSDARQEGNLLEIWTVGNYAIGMRWEDGHDTGIYPFSLLFSLSAEASQ